MKNVPPSVIPKHSCLFHIFFKEAANQSSLKKVNPNKFPNIL